MRRAEDSTEKEIATLPFSGSSVLLRAGDFRERNDQAKFYFV